MINLKLLEAADHLGLQRVASQISLGIDQILRITTKPTSDEKQPE